MEVEGGTKFVLLDSEGSYSPVKVSNELSVVEKEATELFLQARAQYLAWEEPAGAPRAGTQARRRAALAPVDAAPCARCATRKC